MDTSLPPQEVQLTFGGDEEAAPEVVPQNIARDLAILSGEIDSDTDTGAKLLTGGQPADNAQTRWQQGLLKKHELENKIQILVDPHVAVFDLSIAEDCTALAAIMAQVGDPRNGLGMPRGPDTVITDPSSPRGFRVVRVVEWFKTSHAIKGTPGSYEQIS